MNAFPFTTADLPFLNEFQQPGWGDITTHFNFYLSQPFCFAIKIVADKKIIGIGAYVLHDDVAWLAHIIVHADYRNKGTGRYITQCLVDSLKGKCETIYLIATDMGEPVYKKVGFVVEADYLFFNNGNFGKDQQISENIKPCSDNYLSEIKELDKEVYGENREMHFLEYMAESSVFIENNKVQGFYLPKFGDGLILSKNPIAGTELMKLRSKAFENFIFPSENKVAASCLLSNNYVQYRIAKRMRLGKERKWIPENIYNRVSGQIG
ncbi:MAG TPA: GNAT family N-acetyltransferase [Bacteroidia bacterium]|nr:GNAT family N-acetyltransferase [Bacteroidia bacterium]